MKKVIIVFTIFIVFMSTGFTSLSNEEVKTPVFDLENLYDYQKQYKAEDIEICASRGAKTYMDYRMTTVISSRQYQFIHNELTVDSKTGFLYDKDGFIAAALGSYFGEIGDRFYFTLDTGIVLPLVKAEEKADIDTDAMGCQHVYDTSIIEFVIDSDYAGDYFWDTGNGLVLNGNYNNEPLFSGDIERVEKVLEERNDRIVTFAIETDLPTNEDIFNYASGY